MDRKETEGALEAILFAMGDAEAGQVAKAVGHDKETTRRVLMHMMDSYREENRGIQLVELEDSFQLCTKKEYYEYLIQVAKQPKKLTLSDAVMETLSIIAYKQPITKGEIEKIRGVKSDHAVNRLVEYNLVMELGRGAPGKPILFGTTEEFLRNFGVNLWKSSRRSILSRWRTLRRRRKKRFR